MYYDKTFKAPSNSKDFAIDAVIKKFNPSTGPSGTVVTIHGKYFGGAQDGRKLVIGGHGTSAELSVLSWSDTEIKAKIPSLVPNWYYIGIQEENTHWISNINVNFTVTP